MKTVLFALALTVSASAYAHICDSKALSIAQTIDQTNGSHFATLTPSVKASKFYRNDTMTTVTYLTYSFQQELSVLKVKMAPEITTHANCYFEAAKVITQD